MKKLDYSRGAPPFYLQIKLMIKDKIKNGGYPYGTHIPTETEFQELFSVSRITVRQAINELQAEGFVKRHRGKGTEVSYKNIIEEPLSRIRSFTDEIREKGLEPGTLFVNVTTETPSAEIKHILALADSDKVLRVERVRSVNKEPLVHFVTYVAYDERYPTDNADYYDSLYTLFNRAVGREIAYAKEIIGATLADKILAEKLGIKKNSAVLKRTRYSFDRNDVPLEYTVGYYKTEGYNYVITLVQEK